MDGQPKKYTVEDPKGRRITFEWNKPTPPTEADLQQIFSSADTFQTKSFLVDYLGDRAHP